MDTERQPEIPLGLRIVIRTTSAMLAAVLGMSLAGRASADISLEFFPVSTYNTNTAEMNTALGIAGDTIDDFSSTSLISGLTISLAGGNVTSPTTWTSLPNLYNQNNPAANPCGASGTASWTGSYAVINNVTNQLQSCSVATNISKTITFGYAPGTTVFGIGLANFQSLDSPSYPITNHDLYVNGTDVGTIESLAGSNWTPGENLNSYLVITATGGTQITSVEFQNNTALDFLGFSDLAVAAAVPEPNMAWLMLTGIGTLAAIKRVRKPVTMEA